MLRKPLAVLLSGLALAGALTVTAFAQDVKSEIVAKGLKNPSGVAVQPGTGHVFIASHAGVHRLDPKTGALTAEITGYPNPTDIYGKGPKYDIGPLGLAFLDAEHLVVGDGSRIDGEELVRIYKVGKTPAAEPQKEGAAVFTLGPLAASELTEKGEGNFYGVAASGQWIYVTCNGDDTKGWIARAAVTNGKPGRLELTIATKEATEVDAPGPAVFSRNGNALIVGQIGEINVEGDSLLTFYSVETGKLQRKLPTGLNDIAGLAFSPTSNRLYATDFSWIDTSKGGLFRLMPGPRESTEAKATKLLSLDKPAGMAFDAEGNLYIAVFGTAAEGSDQPAGQIVKVSGL